MNEIKNFMIASLSAFGLVEFADTQIAENNTEDPQTWIIKTSITVLVGLLTTILSRWLKKKEIKRGELSNNKKVKRQKN